MSERQSGQGDSPKVAEAPRQSAAEVADATVVRNLALRLVDFCDGAKRLYQKIPVEPGERYLIVRGYGLSILDMSWTLARMLSVDPVRSHVTCLTLWRPMYERWLRMGYFAACAYDAEVAAFVINGALPKSRVNFRRNGDACEMSAREFSQLVAEQLPPLRPKFEELAGEYNPVWSDLVHGGVNLVRLYATGSTVGSKAAPGVVVELLYRTALVVVLTTSYSAMHLARQGNEDYRADFRRLDDEVTAFLNDCNALAVDPRSIIRMVE